MIKELKMDVSIVIPTKNAGPIFDKVLSRVFVHFMKTARYTIIPRKTINVS